MRRQRRTQPEPTLPMAAAPPGDAERILWLLVGEAQAERALLAASDDMDDIKALGLLGLDGAVIAGLTAARSQLPSLWWVAVIALAVCVPFFLITIRGWPVLFGPDLAQFYAQTANSSALDAGAQLFADLQVHMRRNREALAPKARAFAIGMQLFILGALFSAIFLARMALVP
jgi:hypothetical protein